MTDDRDRRAVGPLHLLALGINGIVGVGIFFAPADVEARAPGAGAAVFAGTALLLVPVALAFAVLGGRFDEDGGPVVFAREAFGALPAFVVGWIAYVSAIASSAAVSVGLAAAVAPMLGVAGAGGSASRPRCWRPPSPSICAAGLRLSARTWTALTVLKLLPLVALALVYLASPGCRAGGGRPRPRRRGASRRGSPRRSWRPSPTRASRSCPCWRARPAGRPRAVPFATVGSLAAAALLYVALQAACASALPDLGGVAGAARGVGPRARRAGPGRAGGRGHEPLRARDRVRDDGGHALLPGRACARWTAWAWGWTRWTTAACPAARCSSPGRW